MKILKINERIGPMMLKWEMRGIRVGKEDWEGFGSTNENQTEAPIAIQSRLMLANF